MQTAEVVIIGGGIVGSSIALHLTNAGCKSVLVIERES
jgi:sarcosine oxidase subunit beta